MSYKHVGTPGAEARSYAGGHSEHWKVRFGCSLKVECTACGAARTLKSTEVIHIHPNRARLELLEKRLVCSRCKRKAARLVVLPPVYPR